jgi:tetratricopeptide (TPR) repeat protein
MRCARLVIFFAAAALAFADGDIDRGQALFQSAHYSEARLIFGSIAESEPENARACYYLGRIAVRECDYETAVRFLERSVAIAPAESDFHLWLGNAYAWAAATAPLAGKAELGRKCLVTYRRAIDLYPGNLAAHFGLMNFYRHVPGMFGGGMAKAYGEAETIRQLDPDKGALAMAILRFHEKQSAEAFTLLTGLVRKSPSDYAAHCELGRAGVETGTHLDEAGAAFRVCLTLCPTENDEGHDFVHWGLGRIAELEHDHAGARQAYEACLKLNPHFAPAKEALARLP